MFLIVIFILLNVLTKITIVCNVKSFQSRNKENNMNEYAAALGLILYLYMAIAGGMGKELIIALGVFTLAVFLLVG